MCTLEDWPSTTLLLSCHDKLQTLGERKFIEIKSDKIEGKYDDNVWNIVKPDELDYTQDYSKSQTMKMVVVANDIKIIYKPN